MWDPSHPEYGSAPAPSSILTPTQPLPPPLLDWLTGTSTGRSEKCWLPFTGHISWLLFHSRYCGCVSTGVKSRCWDARHCGHLSVYSHSVAPKSAPCLHHNEPIWACSLDGAHSCYPLGLCSCCLLFWECLTSPSYFYLSCYLLYILLSPTVTHPGSEFLKVLLIMQSTLHSIHFHSCLPPTH